MMADIAANEYLEYGKLKSRQLFHTRYLSRGRSGINRQQWQMDDNK